MNYKEALELFSSEETLTEILKKCKPHFDIINHYSNIFENNLINNPEECKEALNKLTGVYMYLKPILYIAETTKKNNEVSYYFKKKSEFTGTKFVSTPVEKEASHHVKNFRRIRNILQGYMDSCDKAISSCQSILKHMAEEIRLNR